MSLTGTLHPPAGADPIGRDFRQRVLAVPFRACVGRDRLHCIAGCRFPSQRHAQALSAWCARHVGPATGLAECEMIWRPSGPRTGSLFRTVHEKGILRIRARGSKFIVWAEPIERARTTESIMSGVSMPTGRDGNCLRMRPSRQSKMADGHSGQSVTGGRLESWLQESVRAANS
jgi:hypothetical protein